MKIKCERCEMFEEGPIVKCEVCQVECCKDCIYDGMCNDCMAEMENREYGL